MVVEGIMVNRSCAFVSDQMWVARWFWGGCAALIMFLMSYSHGLHAGNPYYIYSYPILALALAYLFFVAKSFHFKFYLGIFPTIFGWFFLCSILMASIIGGQGYFSAVHVVSWHIGIMMFWFLFHARMRCNPMNCIVIGWLSVLVLAMAALLVGLYIQFIGPISFGGLTFKQPLYRGFPYQRLISWFQSPNRTGPYFLYGLMGCVFLLHWAKSKTHRLFLIASAISLTIGIFLSGSRSAIGASAIFLLVSFFSSVALSLRRLFVVLLVAVSLIGLFITTDIGHNLASVARIDHSWIYIEESDIQIQIHGRSHVWERAFDVLKLASPIQQILGMGPGAISTKSGTSSHSGWITVFIEEGLVAFLFLFFFIASLIVQSFNRYLMLRQEKDISRFFLNQAAFWLAFSALNVTTAIFPVPKLDNFVMLMVLVQFGILNAAVRRKYKFSS